MAILRFASEQCPNSVGDGVTTTYSFPVANPILSLLSVSWNGNGASPISGFAYNDNLVTVVFTTAPPAYSTNSDLFRITATYLF